MYNIIYKQPATVFYSKIVSSKFRMNLCYFIALIYLYMLINVHCLMIVLGKKTHVK